VSGKDGYTACQDEALTVDTGEDCPLSGGPVFRLATLNDAVTGLDLHTTQCIKDREHNGQHYDGDSVWWPSAKPDPGASS
jgi:hypothetical protein